MPEETHPNFQSITIDDLVSQFSNYLRKRDVKRKRRSAIEKTAKQYASDLRLLLYDTSFLDDYIMGDQEDYIRLHETIEGKIKELKQSKEFKESTKLRKICAVRAFYDFLDSYVGISLKKPKPIPQEKGPLEYVTKDQFSSVMEKIPKDDFKSARDRAIFALLFYTGIRIEEVLKIRYNNWVRTDKEIQGLNIGLAFKKRYIPLDKRVTNELKNYEEAFEKSGIEPSLESEAYFRNKFGNHSISGRSVRRKLTKYYKSAKLQQMSPTQLRYGCYKREKEGGTPEGALAKQVGLTSTVNVKNTLGRLQKQN